MALFLFFSFSLILSLTKGDITVQPTGSCNASNAYCQYYRSTRYCCPTPQVPTAGLGGNCVCPDTPSTGQQAACDNCNYIVDDDPNITALATTGNVVMACYNSYGCRGGIGWNTTLTNNGKLCQANAALTQIFSGYGYFLISCNNGQLSFQKCQPQDTQCKSCLGLGNVVPEGYCGPQYFDSYSNCVYYCGTQSSSGPISPNSGDRPVAWLFVLIVLCVITNQATDYLFPPPLEVPHITLFGYLISKFFK